MSQSTVRPLLLRAFGAVALTGSTGVLAPRAVAAQTADLYQFDFAHAVLEFGVRLVGFNRVRGSFDKYDGHILFVGDDPLRSAVSLSIEVKSIHTGVEERDADLRDKSFFDAERWPRITFMSRRVERERDAFVAIGPLTIRDSTREVRVPFSIIAPKGTDPFGNTRFSVAGRLVLNRRDFGVIGPAFWNHAISDSVEIEFEMPGRRWGYTSLGWGPATRTSGGHVLFDAMLKDGPDVAAANGWTLFTAHRGDSTYNFAPFEYEKAAGRLSDQGRSREARAALELGIRIADANARPEWVAALHTQLAEQWLRAGDRDRALAHARAALQANAHSTAALMLVQYLTGDQTGASGRIARDAPGPHARHFRFRAPATPGSARGV